MAARILEWIADGQTLSSFCRKRGTPSSRTVENWKYKDEAFASAYARVREIGAGVIADRMREKAAEPIPTGLQKGEANAIVMHRRLIIDTDKWLLARWFPTQYGDRVAISGAEGAPPIQLSNADAAREVALILATAAARMKAAQVGQADASDGVELEQTTMASPRLEITLDEGE